MIIDEKVIMFPPPPPYGNEPIGSVHSSPYGPSPVLPSTNISNPNRGLTLTTLPPHILLQIIHHTFPHSQPQAPVYSPTDQYETAYYEDTKAERQRKTLYWLSTSLRLVSRQLYTACMHVLRSTYLPVYQALIRPGYSSDPFPMGVPTASSSSPNPAVSSNQMAPPAYRSPSPSPSPSLLTFTAEPSPLITPHRETPVLDRFILLKVRTDLFADESSLHLDRDDAFRDLFDVAQPRARLEDLVRIYGVQEGVVYVPGWSNANVQSQAQGGVRKLYTGSNGSQNSLQLLSPLSPSTPSTPTSTSSTAKPTSAPPVKLPNQSDLQPKRSFFFFKKSPSSSHSPSPKPLQVQTPAPIRVTPLAFPSLSITFSPRRIGLVLNRSRTIAEVPRTPGRRDSLESLARALVQELRKVLEEGV